VNLERKIEDLSHGKKIRLAVIRCDTHGYWYGPFLAKCDPLPLE